MYVRHGGSQVPRRVDGPVRAYLLDDAGQRIEHHHRGDDHRVRHVTKHRSQGARGQQQQDHRIPDLRPHPRTERPSRRRWQSVRAMLEEAARRLLGR